MALSLSEAKRRMAQCRSRHGFLPKPVDLLTPPDGNVKLTHSETDRVYAYGLSLAPAGLSGWQVCRYRTVGCEALCLATSGKGAFSTTQRARVWKTDFLATDPTAFLRCLASEIDRLGPQGPW
jgi:hypothetical protein